MLATTNYRSRAVSSTINPWVEDKNAYTQMVSMMCLQLKEVIIWTKKRAILSSQEQFHVKLTHTSELRFTRTKESYITCKVKNKRTWIWCSITSMILAMQIKDQMVDDRQLVVPIMKGVVTSYMVSKVHKLKVECGLKTIFTKLRAWWNLTTKTLIT